MLPLDHLFSDHTLWQEVSSWIFQHTYILPPGQDRYRHQTHLPLLTFNYSLTVSSFSLFSLSLLSTVWYTQCSLGYKLIHLFFHTQPLCALLNHRNWGNDGLFLACFAMERKGGWWLGCVCAFMYACVCVCVCANEYSLLIINRCPQAIHHPLTGTEIILIWQLERVFISSKTWKWLI